MSFYNNGQSIGSFSASFEQYCKGAAPALTGTFTFQDTAAPTNTPEPGRAAAFLIAGVSIILIALRRRSQASLSVRGTAGDGLALPLNQDAVLLRNTERPELHRLLDQLRKGDVLVVWKLDRLSRSSDVLTIMERLVEVKAGFRSLTEVNRHHKL